jgi:glycosyltransferase involved in cell wall biosynthesis
VKTAIVHDWLTGMRGGELVLEEILSLVPEPTIFTLFHFPGSVSAKIESTPIVTSFLQKLPLTPSNYRGFLPLFPRAVESFDLDGFDLVVSSSHCVAKGARPRDAPHLCYCHTPVRYAYDQFDLYFRKGETRFFEIKKMLIGRLRRWDIRTAPRVKRFLANSKRVAERIAMAYSRDSAVVPPAVDVDFYTPGSGSRPELEGDFALCVNALAPYKRIDRAIQWSNATGFPLRIVGAGPVEKRLREMSSSSVSFEKGLSREELRERYRRCAFLLQPGEEDFGIASVEAQACGRPVVALSRGGIRDVLVSPDLGSMFDGDGVEQIVHAIDSLRHVGFNPAAARANAERFSRQRFRENFSRELAAMTSRRTS